jgi:endonuclease/exonuclease/phosphatase family metal-dependent hydrolase
MQIKVISWNIWGGKKREEVIEFLQKESADIIALQEVTTREIDGKKINDAEEIANALGYEFYYSNAFTTDRHFPSYSIGNAILSKFPIQSSRDHFLSDLSDYEKNSTTEPRLAVECIIEVENTTLHVFSTHLGYSQTLYETPLQKKQLGNLLPLIPSSQSILMGDFNSIPESEIIKQIEKKLSHSDRELNKISWINYKDENHSKYRIDYIFTTSDFITVSAHVADCNASDHFPLVLTLSL